MLNFRKSLLIPVVTVSLVACSNTPETQISPTSTTAPVVSSVSPSPENSPSPQNTVAINTNTSTAGKKLFSQDLQLVEPLRSGKIGETIKIPVVVKNTSNFVWDSGSTNPVNFSYNWFDTKGNKVVFNGTRTPLTKPLAPQDSEKLTTVIKFPDRPGNYILALTMVQEGVNWFNDAGAQTPKIPVTVTSE